MCGFRIAPIHDILSDDVLNCLMLSLMRRDDKWTKSNGISDGVIVMFFGDRERIQRSDRGAMEMEGGGYPPMMRKS